MTAAIDAGVMSARGRWSLVVEDEPQMRRFLRASLTSHGYELCEANTAAEAVALATSRAAGAGAAGPRAARRGRRRLTRRLREWSRVPIIVISARGREADKVAALDAGADDYLTKPFGVGELLARMRVALRHAQQAAGTPTPIIEIGAAAHRPRAPRGQLDGAEVHLTPIEYRLLALLAQNAGRVLTHSQILKEVWGPGHAGETHYLRVYMAQLRRKIEAEPARPRLLQTEPGVGYRMREATA